jgi:uncharacterized protein
MTPQERKLIDELFDRLASLERNPRDPDAVRAINEGLQRAPNALYPLVQTTLVQDEALKRADARIRELEQELELQPGEPVKQPGFLDGMRDALLGKPQGSVPTVRPGAARAASPWGNTAAQPGYATQPGGYGAPPQAPGSVGGSFLGTAAATAAGVVGGALLMNSFRGMFGGHNQGQSAFDSGTAADRTPWGSDLSGSDLARDAGVDDIGRGGRMADADYDTQRAGLFDSSPGDSDFDGGEIDVGGDFGSDGDSA